MSIQPGDVVSFAKLALDIYRYGCSDELNATSNYREFFEDLGGLGNNLKTLTDVVNGATRRLRQEGPGDAVARWDPRSLYQIIGDYNATLNECQELIEANERYNKSSNLFRNIEWNVLVQPRVDQLRQRIALHNAKVLQLLKPFEIDLLSRVREDIRHMHEDLAIRITAVHDDIQRMMGVIVPNLDQELNQRKRQHIELLDVPPDIAERIRKAALNDRPEYNTDADFQLEELSDAFVLNFDNGTVKFTQGMKVEERRPSVEQYINLLKCVWIYERIQLLAQGEYMGDDSHWPSFIIQLGEILSFQCARLRQELVTPEVITSQIRNDVFTIWPEREQAQLVDVVTRDEMMEQLAQMPLQGNGSTIERQLKLLRRINSDGRRFRIIISGTEQTLSSRPRQQVEPIDFDITSVTINPLYAMPSGRGMVQEMILMRDERMAKLSFIKMSHILKLQQALTGFKPYDGYYQFGCVVSFIVVGQGELVYEDASLQLWIPKEVDPSLVKTSDAAAGTAQMTSPTRSISFAVSEKSASRLSMRRDSFSSAFSNTFSNPFKRSQNRLSTSPPSLPSIPQRQQTGPGWPRHMSPSPIDTSPPDGQGFYPGSPTQSPGWRPGQSFLSPTSPQAATVRNGTNGRTYSMSSAVSTTAVSTTSKSSSSDGRTTISRGSNTTGYLHRKPHKPMLVLFTQNSQTGKSSLVTIRIDEDTDMNPDRCKCRRSGKDGMSCNVACIEKIRDHPHLDAKRFESKDRGMDLNLACLALNNPKSTSADYNVKKLSRVSIMFPDAAARRRFCGTPHLCKCKPIDQGQLAACLNEGHRGLWGKVQETYRKQLVAYHKARFGAQRHVVKDLMD